MLRLEAIISILDRLFDTKRKQHIAGGMAVSASLLLMGVAVTIFTIKEKETDDELYLE